MNKKENIKVIFYWWLIILFFTFIGRFGADPFSRDNVFYYLILYAVLLIIPSILIYFSDLKSFESKEENDNNYVKKDSDSYKTRRILVSLILFFSDLILFSIYFEINSLTIFGIFGVFVAVIIIFIYTFYLFFKLKQKIIPLNFNQSDKFFSQKPFQYLYIGMMIIMLIATLIWFFGFISSLF